MPLLSGPEHWKPSRPGREGKSLTVSTLPPAANAHRDRPGLPVLTFLKTEPEQTLRSATDLVGQFPGLLPSHLPACPFPVTTGKGLEAVHGLSGVRRQTSR